VMQLRDSNPAIFYPDHWGCFGGAVEAGEPPALALVRELEEELAVTLSPAEVARFTEFSFDFGFAGDGIRLRTYYAVRLPRADVDGLVLGEGAGLAAFEPERLLAMPAWSRTTLSPSGCTMRGGGLHPPAEGARSGLEPSDWAGAAGIVFRRGFDVEWFSSLLKCESGR